jgi:DNA-binding PadR family transcriptional regulator
MKLEHFILGILKLKPSTGYEIKKLLDTEGRFVRPRTPLSQIYNTLKSMTEKGWVTFRVETQEGKPDKKIYSATEAGDRYFIDWLTSPHEPSFRFQDREFLGKLFFSCFVDTETVLKHLYTELEYRQAQIARFRGRDRTIAVNAASGADPACVQKLADLMHQYGVGAIDHYVDWLEEVIKSFKRR